MNTLKSISIFIGLIAFLPLGYEMLLKDKRQSFLSMIFWGLLDLLFGISASYQPLKVVMNYLFGMRVVDF